MIKRIEFLFALGFSLVFSGALQGQNTPDRITVPLSDPARPAVVHAELVNGSITVKAYSGKEVIVEAKGRSRDRSPEQKEGMRRISIGGSGLEVEEQNNRVRIESSSHMHPVDLEIQVPVRTSLKLETVNSGHVTVEGVNGEIEVENINGPVTLNNVSGSAVAHALNGKLTATFVSVDPQKPMSFSSMNGRIDVTLPADVKATVKLKSDMGEVFSDYDIVLKAQPQASTTEGSRDGKGKFKVKIDKAVYGTINGGGPEYQFSNFNGSIFIHKGK